MSAKRIPLVCLLSALLILAVVGWHVALRVFGPERSAKKTTQKSKALRDGAVVARGVELVPTATSVEERAILSLVRAAREASAPAELKIDYPLDGSLFPPEIVPPTFLWHDSSDRADQWLIDVALANGSAHIYVLSEGGPPPPGPTDPDCLGETNEIYKPTPYQASAQSWRPKPETWKAIKANSSARPATVTILGFNAADRRQVLSRGQVKLATSSDPVGAPIFYRDVPLMPARSGGAVTGPGGDPSKGGVIKPLATDALPLIAWRLKDISRNHSRTVLTQMPTCANCHSFSADGETLAMDVDGPSGDKGAYVITPIGRTTVIATDNVITWNSFKDKPEGHKTIGFLSQISPDGQVAVTTVNESLYVANFMDYRCLQVFYPTRGILACYSRQRGEMLGLPGADDPSFVHCDPVWTPDGKSIVFARARARDPFVKGKPIATRANDPAETPIQYDLCRIPFNRGRGGVPRPIEGASRNGTSNTFPKVSPDGRWIVFVKCRNGQLMRPDSRLWIVPAEGGEAREMKCNTPLMNSWHSFSPNGRWLVFSSKSNTPYTQMFLTHIDQEGNDSPAILIPDATAANRAVNIPEFVNIGYDDLMAIEVPAVAHYQHLGRGNELMVARRFQEAIAAYRKALETEPTSVSVNSNIGMCLTELGRLDEAVQCFKKILKAHPRSAEVQNNLGMVLAKQGRIEEAMDHLSQALEINPTLAKAYNNRGLVYNKKRLYDRAILDFSKALEINPKFATVYNNRALAYYFKRQYEKAWGDISTAQSFGYRVHPGFLKALREASGRQR